GLAGVGVGVPVVAVGVVGDEARRRRVRAPGLGRVGGDGAAPVAVTVAVAVLVEDLAGDAGGAGQPRAPALAGRARAVARGRRVARGVAADASHAVAALAFGVGDADEAVALLRRAHVVGAVAVVRRHLAFEVGAALGAALAVGRVAGVAVRAGGQRDAAASVA